MMRKIALALCLMLLGSAAALAQNSDTYFGTPGGGGVNGAVGMCLNASAKAVPCSDPTALASPTTILSASTGGATSFHLIAAATNNATLISTGPHTLYSVQLGSGGAPTVPAYLKIYDKATAPACTEIPIKTLIIPIAAAPANGQISNVDIPVGIKVTLGLGICVTSTNTDGDGTAIGTANTFVINLDYR